MDIYSGTPILHEMPLKYKVYPGPKEQATSIEDNLIREIPYHLK